MTIRFTPQIRLAGLTQQAEIDAAVQWNRSPGSGHHAQDSRVSAKVLQLGCGAVQQVLGAVAMPAQQFPHRLTQPFPQVRVGLDWQHRLSGGTVVVEVADDRLVRVVELRERPRPSAH